MRLPRLFRRRCEREREQVVEEARRSAFLDAAFLMHHCNVEMRSWWPDPKPPEIAPEEVFDAFDRVAYEEALGKVRKMRERATYVGMAYFNYESVTHTFTQARRLLREENPGFSERCYELATGSAITAMR
jgi:hypothetical protein